MKYNAIYICIHMFVFFRCRCSTELQIKQEHSFCGHHLIRFAALLCFVSYIFVSLLISIQDIRNLKTGISKQQRMQNRKMRVMSKCKHS